MNAAAGLCVLLRIGGRPFAARPRSAPWVQAGRGCRLTASVNLTAFERCDRRHKLPHHFLDTAWTAMAAAHPDRGGIPHNTGAGIPLTAALRLDQCASCCQSCSTRAPCRSVMRAIGQRATAAR
jgi:hypothetical protein